VVWYAAAMPRFDALTIEQLSLEFPEDGARQPLLLFKWGFLFLCYTHNDGLISI
jgi:hypothetical protein